MKTLIKLLLISLQVFLVSVIAPCQDKLVTKHLLENVHKWSEGRVFLTDGSELTGLVRFDDNSGILSFRDGDFSKTLIAKSASGFEFYDEELARQRFFFSREYDDGITYGKYYFFEVLMELDHFALLSKVDPIAVEINNGGSAPYMAPYGGAVLPGGSYSTTEVHQTETIFVMGKDGEILPYVRILEKEISGLFGGKRTKNKFYQKDLLEKYTGRHYQQLEAFAKKNGLNFKIKSDLLEILNHYSVLTGSP